MASERAVADVFFALGDRTRLSVVTKLHAENGLSATALAEGAKVSRQAIVKHLRVLEGAGLVTHEKRGREVLYAVDGGAFIDARTFLDGIAAGWDRAIERLRAMVEAPPARRPPRRARPTRATRGGDTRR